jgi:hypothetical protein
MLGRAEISAAEWGSPNDLIRKCQRNDRTARMSNKSIELVLRRDRLVVDGAVLAWTYVLWLGANCPRVPPGPLRTKTHMIEQLDFSIEFLDATNRSRA